MLESRREPRETLRRRSMTTGGRRDTAAALQDFCGYWEGKLLLKRAQGDTAAALHDCSGHWEGKLLLGSRRGPG